MVPKGGAKDNFHAIDFTTILVGHYLLVPTAIPTISLVWHRIFELAFEGCRRTFRPSQLRSVKPRNEKPVRALTNQEGRVPRATGQPLWELST
jgi:hypothetical protein